MKLLLLITALFLLPACGKTFESKTVDQASTDVIKTETPAELSAKAMTVFQQKCVSCHGAVPVSGAGGQITDTNHLLAKGFVIPGDSVNSLIYQRIAKNEMPPGNPLSEQEKKDIRAWIVNGLSNTTMMPISFAPTQAILAAKCTACHSIVGANQGGVNLETITSVRTYLKPGTPYTSTMFDSVLKNRMPLSGAKLSATELSVIYNWILSGAQESGVQ